MFFRFLYRFFRLIFKFPFFPVSCFSRFVGHPARSQKNCKLLIYDCSNARKAQENKIKTSSRLLMYVIRQLQWYTFSKVEKIAGSQPLIESTPHSSIPKSHLTNQFGFNRSVSCSSLTFSAEETRRPFAKHSTGKCG